MVLLVVGLVVLVLVAFAVAGVLGKTGARMRRLALATRVPIADAVDGETVKVQGHISQATPSPLTSRVDGELTVCTHLALTYNHQGTRSVELSRNVPFVVTDDTGEVFVEVAQATVLFGDREATGRREGVAITGWAKEALEQAGMTFSGAPAGRLDIVEQLLVPGDPVSVLGRARRSGRGLVIEGDPEHGVVISGDRSTFD